MKTEESVGKSTSEALLKNFTLEYSSLLTASTSREKERFSNTVEDVLSKLEKFIDIADEIRSKNNLASEETLATLREKSHEVENYFEFIDKLEAFTNMVKEQVNKAEEAVNKAELDLKPNPLKKAISSFSFLANKSGRPTGTIRPSFDPFPIFDSNLFFPTSSHKMVKYTAKGSDDKNDVPDLELQKGHQTESSST